MQSKGRKLQLAIVDYGLGNQKSLKSSCRQLGHRAIISHDQELLDTADVLLLPGLVLSNCDAQLTSTWLG